MDDDPPAFPGVWSGTGFETWTVTVAPGCSRPHDDAEWRDAVVVVEAGEIELECTEGGRRRFGRGAVLWLTGLPLRALHNPGTEPAVLVAVARHPDRRETVLYRGSASDRRGCGWSGG